MKAIEILDCVIYMDLCGEDLIKLEVPSVNDDFNPQTKEWWQSMTGGVPEHMLPEGTYLIFYPNDARDFLNTSNAEYTPDEDIRINDGESVFYLYKLED